MPTELARDLHPATRCSQYCLCYHANQKHTHFEKSVIMRQHLSINLS